MNIKELYKRLQLKLKENKLNRIERERQQTIEEVLAARAVSIYPELYEPMLKLCQNKDAFYEYVEERDNPFKCGM